MIAKYCIRHQRDQSLFKLTDKVLATVRQLAQQRERLMEMAKAFTDLSQDYQAMGLLAELNRTAEAAPSADQRASLSWLTEAAQAGRSSN